MIACTRNYTPKIKIQWQLKSQRVKPNNEVTNQWFEKQEKLRIESWGINKRKVIWKCYWNGVGMAPVANPMPGKSFVSQEYLESEKSRKSTHPFIPTSMNSVCQKKSYLFISVFMCQLNPPGPSTGFPKVNLFSKEIQTFGEYKFSLWPNKNVLIQKRKQGF